MLRKDPRIGGFTSSRKKDLGKNGTMKVIEGAKVNAKIEGSENIKNIFKFR